MLTFLTRYRMHYALLTLDFHLKLQYWFSSDSKLIKNNQTNYCKKGIPTIHYQFGCVFFIVRTTWKCTVERKCSSHFVCKLHPCFYVFVILAKKYYVHIYRTNYVSLMDMFLIGLFPVFPHLFPAITEPEGNE